MAARVLKFKEEDMPDIPESIRRKIENGSCNIDHIGMSDSKVLLFADQVLKIQERSDETDNEVQVLEWLDGRVLAPRLIAQESRGDKSYLLMTRVQGKMACDECYMKDPKRLTDLLAQALKSLWQIDISDCPLRWTLDRKLEAARYNIENDLVDTENVEPDTYGPDGFENPAALLSWLIENKPAEDLVFTHGDFCLPNIFITENGNAGFIDLGRAGLSDKWQDIAICYRSLRDNYSGKYGGEAYPGYEPDMLFEKLGLVPDWGKIRYYILLDELF